MSKNRIIASLLFSENDAFHSQNFLPNKYLGEVSNIIRIWSLQSIDEILIISASDRAIDDLFLEKLKINLRHAFVPISYIGSINSADDASRLIQSGIEKIGIPISKIDESWVPNFTNKYGKQALFTSIDITDSNFNKLIKLIPKASKVSGEIVINNHERNGTFLGINMKIVDSLEKFSDVAIIYSGGANKNDLEYLRSRNSSISYCVSSLFSVEGKRYAPLSNIPVELRRDIDHEMLFKMFDG